jgi:hypothetical protein
MLRRLALTIGIGALACPAGAQSAIQTPQPSPPAYVSAIDGVGLIERDSRVETSPLNMPLVAGDRLRTTEGRMEVRFADGSTLDLDARTMVDVQSDTLLRQMDGRIRVTVRSAPSVTWRIDSPAGSARLAEAGEYRLTLVAGPRQAEGDVQLEFAVFSGRGDISTDYGKTTVSAGERAYASADLLPSEANPFNTALADDFERWPATPAPLSTEASSDYLPSDLQSYASTFDAYGDWLYLPAYGRVWCPRVTLDWRPYSFGRWITYPRYGLTWVGSEPFAWPTHHYGRWGMVGGRWFWMPASNWAPAHVTWSTAGDSVSWAPLGPNNHAVASPASRTVLSRADFDRHTIVPEARPIDQTRTTPIDRAHPRPVEQTRSPMRTVEVPASAARAVPRSSAASQPLVMPTRTSPPSNPVPRSQVRPASPATAPAAAVWRSEPPSATQPHPTQPGAPAAQPAPAPGKERAAPQPPGPSKVEGSSPSRGGGPGPSKAEGQRGQPPAAQQPAHASPRGRGGV